MHRARSFPDTMLNSKPKACIFDLDGTLVDSLADLATAVNRMLDDNGYPRAPLEMFPRYIGDGMKKLVERALPESARDQGNVERCAAEYLRHYEQCWHDQTRVYDGILEVVRVLREGGIRLAVLSNKPHRFTVMCCEHFFPQGVFEVVLGQREGVPRKPDPTAGVEIARRLGLDVSECAYVGDSGIDMEFAGRAGMRRIGVLWGFRGRQEILDNGAEVLVEKPAQLPAAMAASPD